MENIFIIQPSSADKMTIASHLSELDVQCLEFDSVNEAEFEEESPKVVLLFAGQGLVTFQKEFLKLKQSTALSKVPRMLFLTPEIALTLGRTNELEGEAIFRLPVDKAALLARLASMKKGVNRRVFQILIRIQPEGGKLMYFGKSFDFSTTGLAFECSEAFSQGQKVNISFTNPRNKKRITLESEITRKEVLASGGKAFYGARFSDSMAATVRDLVEFIGSGESA